MERKHFKIHGCTKVDLVFKLDDRRLLTTHDGVIKLWEVGKDKDWLTLNFVRDFIEYSKSIKPQTPSIYSSRLIHGERIHWWKGAKYGDWFDTNLVRDSPEHYKCVKALSALTEGYFASCNGDRIRIWYIETGSCVRILEKTGFTDIVDMVELPGGLLVASSKLGYKAGVINVWNLSSGRLVIEDGIKNDLVGQLHCIKGFLVVTPSSNSDHEEDQKIRVYKVNGEMFVEVFSQFHGKISRYDYSVAVKDTIIVPVGFVQLIAYRISDIGALHELHRLSTMSPSSCVVINDSLVYFTDGIGIFSRLWNFNTNKCTTLDNYRNFPTPGKNMAFYEDIFVVPHINVRDSITTIRFEPIKELVKEYNWIRKSARLIGQAYRTRTSYFIMLPFEMLEPIIDALVEYKRLDRDFARSHFYANCGKPSVIAAIETRNNDIEPTDQPSTIGLILGYVYRSLSVLKRIVYGVFSK